MKKTRTLSEITAEITEQVKVLESMVDEVTVLGEYISKINSSLRKNSQDISISDKPFTDGGQQYIADTAEIRPELPNHLNFRSRIQQVSAEGFGKWNPESQQTAFKPANIIPFPGKGSFTDTAYAKNRESFEVKRILAVPEMRLPPGIHDYRPLLQRDGLILLAWDRRITEMGERFTAYWVTSTGIPRYYASKHYSQQDFPSARPDHKSYAAEDGIEFFGQKAPDYLVHVAPELMMSNPRHRELRQAHITILKSQGYDTDYGYTYLLTKEKKRNLLPIKQKSEQSGQTGA